MKKLLLCGIFGAILLMLASCISKPVKTITEEKAVTATGTIDETDTNKKNETNYTTRNTVSASGQISATIIRNIFIEFPASIEKINVKDGQKIKSGESLLTLDLTEFNEQIKNMELELHSLQSEIVSIRNAYTNNNSPEIKIQLNNLKIAENSYNKALKEYSDNKKLFDAGSSSKYDLDEAQETVDEAKQGYDNIKLSIDNIKHSKKLEWESKNLAITKLESDLNLMKNMFQKPYIKSNEVISVIPNGAVFDISYVDGDIIAPANKVLSIMDLDSLIVKAEIAEKYIKNVELGYDAIMIPRSDNSKQYKGKVIRKSSVPITRDGEVYVPIEISIDNKDGFLLPNFSVEVKIDIK